MNRCGLVIGLSSADVSLFLDFARSALADSNFYCRRDYAEGVLLAYDMLAWDTDNEDIKRLINFLHMVAELGKPVAFIRWGDDFEAWANKEGYRIFRNTVKHKDDPCRIELAPDYEPSELAANKNFTD